MPDATDTLVRAAVADIARAAPDPHPFHAAPVMDLAPRHDAPSKTGRRLAGAAAAAIALVAGVLAVTHLREPTDPTTAASPEGTQPDAIMIEPPSDWPTGIVHEFGEELLAGGETNRGSWALVGRPSVEEWPMGSAGCVLLRPTENLFTCEPRPAGRALAWVVPKGAQSILEITAPSDVRTIEVQFLDADQESLPSTPRLSIDVGSLIDRGYPPVAALDVPDGATYADVALYDQEGQRVPVKLDAHIDHTPPLIGGEDDRIIQLVPTRQTP